MLLDARPLPRLLALLPLLAALGCTDDKPSTEARDAGHGSLHVDPATADAALAAAATADAGPADAGDAVPMPERPVPRDTPVVSMTMSEEVQMKAIQYMIAMRAPRPVDPAVDEAYVADVVKKLKGASLAVDRGAGKASMNRTEAVASGRQIDLLMADGCTPETPKKIAVQRAGIPLSILHAHGVLALRCNDKKLQCLQSTRDPGDVLCTSAPRKPAGSRLP